MLRNYVTVAVRGLFKNKLYSSINIFGLAVGLAACLLILLFVRDELSYDRWIPDSERIYRVHTRFDIPGRNPLFAVNSPGVAIHALQKDFSEIETAVRVNQQRPVIKRGNDVFYEDMLLADGNFFDVFQLPFVTGERATALNDATAIVVSEAMAKKYFGGTGTALGQVLTVSGSFGTKDMRVTGVFKDLPSNTHFKIELMGKIVESDYEKQPWMFQSWTSLNSNTYIKLKPGVDVNNIRRTLPEFETRNVPNLNVGGNDFKTADFMELTLVNLADLHLHSKGVGGYKDQGDAKAVTTFSAVALMILLIACINFTNLATARASLRAREVALRKVLGARRSQLVIQFLGESVLLAVVALAVALVLVFAALPMYNSFLGRTLAISVTDGTLWLGMIALVLMVGVVGGIYPALYLSQFSPARILKANKSASTKGSGRLRTALVVLQFAISIGLIVCTAVVYSQTVYMRTMDLGFNKSGLLAVRGIRREAALSASDALREEFARIPGVVDVTRSEESPADSDEDNTLIEIPGKVSPQPLVIGEAAVDYNFFQVMEIPVIAGRSLSRDFGADDLTGEPKEVAERGGNVVISRDGLKLLGLTDPAQAIGMQIRMAVGNGDKDNLMAPITIVGVVENVRYDSARTELRPMLYRYRAKSFNYAYLRIRNADSKQVEEAAARVWRELIPTQPFFAEFVEAKLSALYDAEEARAKMFAAFAGLAVIVACLGLYGLASFTAERRTKEIGIRKVLGARIRDIVRILAWDFSKPVLVANVLAWPVAWWVMRDWLNAFEVRVALNPTIFIVAGLGALVIALATVAVHTARVARANPIYALRYE
jgi:putative ABC transport system permease protein